jgi:hypothetical protein
MLSRETESTECRETAIPLLPGRSVIVSTSVPAAPQDGHAPNHCSAVAPQSEHT